MVITAKDVCNKAITVEATKMMSDVRDTMLKYNISRMIIEHNQKPVGMVTEKGISRYLYKDNNDKSLDEIVISKAMRTPLISVAYNKDIRECAKLMQDNGISSLLVEEDGDGRQKSICIFTKSDLVKLYAENYKGKYTVGDFSTKQVFTISSSNSLHTAMKTLLKEKVSRIIVTNRDNEIVGIVTAKDLMPITAFAEGEKLQSNTKEGEEETEKKNLSSIGHAMIVRDIMKKSVITVKATDDLAKAAQIMTDKRISGLPVSNPNDSKTLVGIVTKTDIVNALIKSN
jgi:CBS domain-containing protein